MNTLDLYKNRKYSIIKLSDNKEYKIANEYTVEEVERLLELKSKQDNVDAEIVIEEKKDEQVETFYKIVFDQLEIIFQHYHPEVDTDYLKKIITHNEALEMIGFFVKHRDSNFRKAIDKSAKEVDLKKKLN